MNISKNIKQKARSFVLMAFSTLGFILWTALTDRIQQSLLDYVTLWLVITAFFFAVFIIGMVTNYLLDTLIKAKLAAKCTAAIERLLSSVERRFRGDRTDAEYQRAENGLIILVAIIFLLGMLFFVGVWAIAAFSLLIGLALTRNIFIILNSDAESNTSNLGLNLFWGFCFAFVLDFLYKTF